MHVGVFMVTCINHSPLLPFDSLYSLFVMINQGSRLNGEVSSVLLWCQLQTRDPDKRLHIFKWKKYGLYLWIIGNKMPCTNHTWFITGKWRLRTAHVYVESRHIFRDTLLSLCAKKWCILNILYLHFRMSCYILNRSRHFGHSKVEWKESK